LSSSRPRGRELDRSFFDRASLRRRVRAAALGGLSWPLRLLRLAQAVGTRYLVLANEDSNATTAPALMSWDKVAIEPCLHDGVFPGIRVASVCSANAKRVRFDVVEVIQVDRMELSADSVLRNNACAGVDIEVCARPDVVVL